MNDYRPGMEALKELGVRSPLKEAGLTKEDIRSISRDMNLPTWNKPTFACLSSRFPYGSQIDIEKLQMVEEAENFLLDHGFNQVRVRHHDDTARIEILPENINDVFKNDKHRMIVEKLKTIGYRYVTLDLEGYRTGSMNEVLEDL